MVGQKYPTGLQEFNRKYMETKNISYCNKILGLGLLCKKFIVFGFRRSFD